MLYDGIFKYFINYGLNVVHGFPARSQVPSKNFYRVLHCCTNGESCGNLKKVLLARYLVRGWIALITSNRRFN